ncbi:MAG: PIN domain-containing protein, partial [Candidatus Rokubacteria bacterium]|nr:PIN domain-containing protein [Candidatus Rokubacteria bacterium]
LLRLRLEAPGTERAVAALARTLDDLWDRIDCLEITEEICTLAGRIAPASRLRTLDAIHLATFHQLRRTDPGMRMLTFDERLLRELV